MSRLCASLVPPCSFQPFKALLLIWLISATLLPVCPLLFIARCCSLSPRFPALQSAFMQFAEQHRRLINVLVHHKPELLQTSMSLLLRAPKLLDFDNK